MGDEGWGYMGRGSGGVVNGDAGDEIVAGVVFGLWMYF